MRTLTITALTALIHYCSRYARRDSVVVFLMTRALEIMRLKKASLESENLPLDLCFPS